MQFHHLPPLHLKFAKGNVKEMPWLYKNFPLDTALSLISFSIMRQNQAPSPA